MVPKSDSDIIYSEFPHPKGGSDIYDRLEFHCTKKWKEQPPTLCPRCGHTVINGVEILGAYRGPLFWECVRCGEKMLRFSKKTTIRHLEKTVDLYVDLEGLNRIWEEIPN